MQNVCNSRILSRQTEQIGLVF